MAWTTRKKVAERRMVVLSFLNDKYRLPRNASVKVLKELARLGFQGTQPGTISNDTKVIRFAALYRNAGPRVGAKVAAQALQNGVKEHVLYDVIRNVLVPYETEQAAKKRETAPKEPVGGGVNVLETETEYVILPQKELTRVIEACASVQKGAAWLIEENERQRVRIAELERTLSEVQKKISAAKPASYVDHLKTPFPQVQGLLETKEQMGRQQSLAPQPVPELPKEALWPGLKHALSFIYHQEFHESFAEMQNGKKRQVVKALISLATKGPKYAGLKTHKYPNPVENAPEGCDTIYASRVQRSWRILWGQTATELHVLALGKHRDFYRSEV